MPLSDTAHLMRDRAESCGAGADLYDRYRPSYPDELIADLAALVPAGGHVLDIGTGTGKASRLLVARGVDVLGVEIDAKMAEVARGHGVPVEVSGFEAWDDRGRTFDLVVSAQAWHWVQPGPGAAKVGRLLRPGGAFSPFWNFEDLTDAEQAAADAVYAEVAPDLAGTNVSGANRPQHRPYVDDLTASGQFASVAVRTYRWAREYPVDFWVERVGTHSDHLSLGADRLAELQSALRAGLGALGPAVHTEGGTYVVEARKAA
jgi:SAM-dependent methyltransferase